MMAKPHFSLLQEDGLKYASAHSPVLSLMEGPPLHQGLILQSGKTHGRTTVLSVLWFIHVHSLAYSTSFVGLELHGLECGTISAHTGTFSVKNSSDRPRLNADR